MEIKVGQHFKCDDYNYILKIVDIKNNKASFEYIKHGFIDMEKRNDSDISSVVESVAGGYWKYLPAYGTPLWKVLNE